MNLLQIIFITTSAIALYELFVRPYFQKIKLAGIEKETVQLANLIGGDGVFPQRTEKKAVESFLKIYSYTKFNQNQIALKLEVAKLLYFYVNTVLRTLNARETIDELTILEKRQYQLENILKNIFEYLKDSYDENEFKNNTIKASP